MGATGPKGECECSCGIETRTGINNQTYRFNRTTPNHEGTLYGTVSMIIECNSAMAINISEEDLVGCDHHRLCTVRANGGDVMVNFTNGLGDFMTKTVPPNKMTVFRAFGIGNTFTVHELVYEQP